MHSIKAVSKLSGVKTDTIRSWERRYGAVTPSRDENGRRSYSSEDVSRLSLIAKLAADGHGISRLAELRDEQLAALRDDASTAAPDGGEQRIVNLLAQAIETYDLDQFRYHVGSAMTMHPPLITVENILVPTLRRIGKLWESGKIDVGVEHVFSGIIKQHLLSAIGIVRWSAVKPTIIFTTVSGEDHEIGVLMGCYIAALDGFHCHYFGPNMPVSDLIKNAQKLGGRALVISLVHIREDSSYIDQMTLLADQLADETEIFAGIAAHNRHIAKRFPKRVKTFTSYQPFYQALKLLDE